MSKYDDYIKNLNDIKLVASDSSFIDESLQSHIEPYSNILNEYSENLIDNNSSKRCHKKIMFFLSCFILIVSFLIGVFTPFVYLFTKKEIEIANYLSILLPELITLITSFMVIPKIITNYLFNREEEKYMTQIITNTQNFDFKLYCKRNNLK